MSEDLAWAAGLLEGEGTVTFARRNRANWTLVVYMVNCDAEIVDFFQARWPGYIRTAQGVGNRRVSYRWELCSLKAMAFLNAVEPFIQTTRTKQRIALARRLQEMKARRQGGSPEALDLVGQMKMLNHRGLR